MTNPHQQQQDHSRDADDIFDEIRALMRRARANAENALRLARVRQQRRQYSSRTRHTRPHPAKYASTGAPIAAGLTEDLMARWAGAHAAATLAREEAELARRENAHDDAATAHAEEAAQRAEAWADAWDERLRHAGLDPDSIGRDDPRAEYTQDAEYMSAPEAYSAADRQYLGQYLDRDSDTYYDTLQSPDWGGASDVVDLEEDRQSQYWAIPENAADYALYVDDAAHDASPAPASVGELLADTRPSPQTDLQPATDLSGPGQVSVGESVGLDTGASL